MGGNAKTASSVVVSDHLKMSSVYFNNLKYRPVQKW